MLICIYDMLRVVLDENTKSEEFRGRKRSRIRSMVAIARQKSNPPLPGYNVGG
jgi:hypothetical protein